MSASLNESIKIIIDVVANGKEALPQIAKGLQDLNNAAKTAASGIQLSTKQIVELDKALTNSAKAATGARNTLKEVSVSAKNAGNSAKTASTGFDSLIKKISALAVVYATIRTAMKMIDTADEYQLLDARIKLVVGSEEKLIETHKMLYEAANNSNTSFTTTSETFIKFAKALQGTNVSEKDIIGMIETLNKSLIVSGKSADEASAMVDKMAKAFRFGTVTGIDFREIMNNGGMVVQLMCDYLNVTADELRLMAEQGKITGDVLYNSMAGGADKVNKAFSALPTPIGEAQTKLKNVFNEIIDKANKGGGATKSISQAIIDITTELKNNESTIVETFKAIAEAAGFVATSVAKITANMATFIRASSAVAAGQLSIGEAIGMDKEDFVKWDKEFDTEIGVIKRKIAKAKEEISRQDANGGAPELFKEDLVKLEEQLAKAVLEKAKKDNIAASQAAAEAVNRLNPKLQVHADTLDKIKDKYLAATKAMNEYNIDVENINKAEKAGQFSKNADENARLAETARKNAKRQLDNIIESQNKLESGANGANTAWQQFGNTVRQVEAQIANMNKEKELAGLQKIIECQKEILGAEAESNTEKNDTIALIDRQIEAYQRLLAAIPASQKGKSEDTQSEQLQTKINDLLVQRAKAQVDINNSTIRALDDQIIQNLELEKIEAGKLGSAKERAQAEVRITEEILKQKIAQKDREIKGLEAKGGNKSIMDEIALNAARTELSGLNLELKKVQAEGSKKIASDWLRDLSDRWRETAASVDEYRMALQAAKESKAISEQEFDEKMVASGTDMWAALTQGFKQAKREFQTDAETMIQIGHDLPGQLTDGFASAFQDFITGAKTAKEAFADFARSTLSWLIQLIAKQLVLDAVQSVGFFGDGGQIGAVQKKAAGGRIHGSSPSDKADNIPIWATAGEFMQPVRAVRHYGVSFMEAIRTLKVPKSTAKAMVDGLNLSMAMPSFRLAAGGPVPSMDQLSQITQAGGYKGGDVVVKGGDTNLRIANVLDKNLIGDFLQSADGEDVLINTIRRNGSTIRTIIGS